MSGTYSETLPRRGYRFIAPVESGNGAMEVPQLPQAPEQRVVAGTKRWTLVTSALCLFGLVAIAIWLTHRPAEVIPRVIDSAQITKDGLPKFNATFKLVSDGTRLYFHEGSLDQTEQNTALMQEVDCTFCPFMAAAVAAGQRMGKITFIKRRVISGFYRNNNLFLVRFNLATRCS
jgi:hypothetical protein